MLFNLVMAISCNNDKENMMTKKFVMPLPIKEHNKQCKHFYIEIMKRITRIKNSNFSYRRTVWGPADINSG